MAGRTVVVVGVAAAAGVVVVVVGSHRYDGGSFATCPTTLG